MEIPWSSILIPLIPIGFLIFFLASYAKKNKNRGLRQEMINYYESFHKHEYSGNITVMANGVKYGRGLKEIIFPIVIEKETLLKPEMVSEWFAGRNYNSREERIILEDIAYFLKENGYCKNVSIITEEEE